jgi:hypothetical protein
MKWFKRKLEFKAFKHISIDGKNEIQYTFATMQNINKYSPAEIKKAQQEAIKKLEDL